MGTYRLTRKADEDLTSLYRYGIDTFEESRADSYIDNLIARLAEIGDAPMQFRKSDDRAAIGAA